MENQTGTSRKTINSENANNPSHYATLTVGIFVTVLGMMLRFIEGWSLINMVSNIVLVIGVVICLKAVIAILK